MGKFYTNAELLGDAFLLRYVDENGKHKKEKFYPSYDVYHQSTDGTSDGFTAIDGSPLKKISFNRIWEAKTHVDQYKGSGIKLYYNHRFKYGILNGLYPDKIEYDIDKINVGILDIETESENGWPKPELATERINSITFALNNHFHVFCYEQIDMSDVVNKHDEVIELHVCQTEKELLETFLDVWSSDYPDVVSGWYSNGFDIPYIVNRIINVLGEEYVERLSPWKKVELKLVDNDFGGKEYAPKIYGISLLDYLPLYKKYVLTKREQYTLAHIGSVEKLDEQKMAYEGTLQQFYKTNYQKFVKYNIDDVKVIRSLERKRRLLELAFLLAYQAKVNYDDVFWQMRMWECRIMNELHTRKILPEKTHGRGNEDIIGGFVKEALPGMEEWLVTLDLDSLYPTLMELLNVSPETLNQTTTSKPIDIDAFVIDKKLEIHENEITALNQVRFRKDKRGFLPEMIRTMKTERKMYKKLQNDEKQKLQLIEKEIQRRTSHG